MDGKEESSEQKRKSPVTEPRRVMVSEILRGAREVILDHDGQTYRLRLTLAGKLILTK